MTPDQLIEQLKQHPVAFSQVMAVIDAHYHFTPSRFSNGQQINAAGENNGSCKIFAFARLHQLDEQTTLNAFGDFYTQDVLQHPDATDHQNIRQFMQHGWSVIEFETQPLNARAE